MSSLYKVTKIEGKGLGCVAISDIKKGSLILTVNPKLYVETEETEGSSIWIKSLLKSFYQMSKADQHEFMTLYNKFNNFQNFQDSEEVLAKMIKMCKLEIGKIEQDQRFSLRFMMASDPKFAEDFSPSVKISDVLDVIKDLYFVVWL